MPTDRICMSMILLEPAYKILHTTVKFKRRTISVTPYLGNYDLMAGLLANCAMWQRVRSWWSPGVEPSTSTRSERTSRRAGQTTRTMRTLQTWQRASQGRQVDG